MSKEREEIENLNGNLVVDPAETDTAEAFEDTELEDVSGGSADCPSLQLCGAYCN